MYFYIRNNWSLTPISFFSLTPILFLRGFVKVFCRLAVRLAVTAGLRSSAPSDGISALAAVPGLSKCH